MTRHIYGALDQTELIQKPHDHPVDLPARRGHAHAFKLRRRPGRGLVLAGRSSVGVQPGPRWTGRVAVAVAVVPSPRRELCGVPSTWQRPTARRPGRRPRHPRRPTSCSSASGAACGSPTGGRGDAAPLQRWLDEQTTALVTGNYVDPNAGKVSFGAYFDRWAARQVWAPGTARAMSLAARSVTFWNVPMRSLLRSHVEAWVKAMQTADRGKNKPRGLAPGTIRTRFNNVRAVLRGAVKDRIIATDPSDGVRLPRTRRADVAMELPTTEQVRGLLDAADPRFRTFVALCAFAGLRLGEAAAVQAGDFDLRTRRLDVRRQVQRESAAGVEIRPPKYGSERTVHLADGLVAIVEAHLIRVPGKGPDRWLFHGENDNPPHQNTVGYWWRKTRTAAGYPTVELHDLRHFYASGLIAAGCDVVTVQRALGHSSATVTLNTYAHLWPTAEDRTRAGAAAMLAAVLGTADEPLTNEPAA